MALRPDQTLQIDDDVMDVADRLEEAIDRLLLGRRTGYVLLDDWAFVACGLAARHELAARYRLAGWHVFDVEDLDEPMCLVASTRPARRPVA